MSDKHRKPIGQWLEADIRKLRQLWKVAFTDLAEVVQPPNTHFASGVIAGVAAMSEILGHDDDFDASLVASYAPVAICAASLVCLPDTDFEDMLVQIAMDDLEVKATYYGNSDDTH